MRGRIFKSTPVHASVIISLPEFSESSAQFLLNNIPSSVQNMMQDIDRSKQYLTKLDPMKLIQLDTGV